MYGTLRVGDTRYECKTYEQFTARIAYLRLEGVDFAVMAAEGVPLEEQLRASAQAVLLVRALKVQ